MTVSFFGGIDVLVNNAGFNDGLGLALYHFVEKNSFRRVDPMAVMVAAEAMCI